MLPVKYRSFWLHTVFLLVSLSLVISVNAAPGQFTGKVVNVADGDTITVLTEGNQSVKVRLAGIDCPEGGQAFGNKAKQFLAPRSPGNVSELLLKPPTVMAGQLAWSS